MIITEIRDKYWNGHPTKAEMVVYLRNMDRIEMLSEYNLIKNVLSGKSIYQTQEAYNIANSFMEAWNWAKNERGKYDIFSDNAPYLICGVTCDEIYTVEQEMSEKILEVV